jgi:hypothetical protein
MDSEIPWKEKVAIFMHNGKIIGGYVTERSKEYVRLQNAFEIHEEKVIGSLSAIYGRGLSRGTMEIPFSNVSHWDKVSKLGLPA